ncbi:MAG: LysM peptidoglycan-binding domain-containing protein [Clostridiales bacterium]|jgi:hypothetical protein|nr:LysM peptidoglycan-binding domain-containing protein [Clostridiales bacterium]
MKRRRIVKKDRTLHIFETLGRIASLPKVAFLRLKKAKRYREISLVAFGIFAILAGLFAFDILRQPNALAVYVDGENLGILRQNGGRLDPEYLEMHTLTRLQSRFGTAIFPTKEIYASPVRVGRNAETISFDSMVTALENALDFYVYAAEIRVNGARAAILPSAAEAYALLDGIKGENYEFIEDIIVANIAIHNSYVLSRDEALEILTTPRVVRKAYTVRPGDNLYNIARNFGMSLSALLAANPDVNPEAFLREGDLLVVMPNIPVLNVRPVGAD